MDSDAYLLFCAVFTDVGFKATETRIVPASTVLAWMRDVPIGTGINPAQYAMEHFGSIPNMIDYISTNYLYGRLATMTDAYGRHWIAYNCAVA